MLELVILISLIPFSMFSTSVSYLGSHLNPQLSVFQDSPYNLVLTFCTFVTLGLSTRAGRKYVQRRKHVCARGVRARTPSKSVVVINTAVTVGTINNQFDRPIHSSFKRQALASFKNECLSNHDVI